MGFHTRLRITSDGTPNRVHINGLSDAQAGAEVKIYDTSS